MRDHKTWGLATCGLVMLFTVVSFLTTKSAAHKLDNENSYKKYTYKTSMPSKKLVPIEIKHIEDKDTIASDVEVISDKEVANYLEINSHPEEDLSRYVEYSKTFTNDIKLIALE